MKKSFLYLLLLLPMTFIRAQETEQAVDFTDEAIIEVTEQPTPVSVVPAKKIKFGADAGMAYTVSSAGYSGPSFLLSPYASYPINNRLSLRAGVSMEYSQFYYPHYTAPGESAMLPMTRMFLYASGNYKVNERLDVNGGVYQQVQYVPNRTPGQTQSQYNSHGISMGFNYKITPSVSFSAQIRMEQPGFSDSYSPVRNPYQQSGVPGWW